MAALAVQAAVATMAVAVVEAVVEAMMAVNVGWDRCRVSP